MFKPMCNTENMPADDVGVCACYHFLFSLLPWVNSPIAFKEQIAFLYSCSQFCLPDKDISIYVCFEL